MTLNSSLNTLAAAAFALLSTAFLDARAAYETIFTQDFEGDDYAAQMSGGAYDNALFGTTAKSEAVPSADTVCASNRTLYAGGTSKIYWRKTSDPAKKSTGSWNSLFALPDDVVTKMTNRGDYVLEFDYYLNFCTTSGFTGLAIQGENGAIATFYATPGEKNLESTSGKLYLGDTTDTELISEVKGFSRGGTDPASSSCSKYWMHVTVTGIATGPAAGLYLEVVRDNQEKPATLLAKKRIGDYDVVKGLYQRASGTPYAVCFSLDDVIVSAASEAATYTWTGAVDANWTTPGNWKVGDTQQTKLYPGSKDTAIIPADQTITVPAQTSVASLQLASGSKLSFDVSGLSVNEMNWLFYAADGTAPSADNVTVTGITADDYSIVYDNTPDTTTLKIGLYEKSKFFWTGKGADNEWSTVANWAYGAKDGPVVTTAPTTDSTVTFPQSEDETVAVQLVSDMNMVAVVLERDVTFVGSGDPKPDETDPKCRLVVTGVSGAGKLSLDGVRLQTSTNNKITIASDLVILPNEKYASVLYLRGASAKFTLTGAITGSGVVKLTGDTNGSGGKVKSFSVEGDWSGFAGKVIVDGDSSRTMSFKGNDSTIDFSNAEVEIDESATMLLEGTYANNMLKIGALTGSGVIRNKNAASSLMTLEVGARNGDAESSATFSQADTITGNWTVRKVGTGRQAILNLANTNNLEVAAGEFEVLGGQVFGTMSRTGGALSVKLPDNEATWADGNPHVLFTATSGATEFNVDGALDLDLTAFEKGYEAAYTFVEDGTSVSATLTEAAYHWTGAVNNDWDNAGNWTLAGKVAEVAPGESAKVSITGEGLTIAVAPDMKFGSGWTFPSDLKFAVKVTAEGTVSFTPPTNFNTANVIAAGPFTLTYADGVFTATRQNSEFVWSGDAGDGAWNTTANWKVDGIVSGVVPGAGDNVTLGKEATISIADANAYVSNLTVNAAVTLAGAVSQTLGDDKYLNFGDQKSKDKTLSVEVSGTGPLTLSNVTFMAGFSTITVNTPIVVPADAVARFVTGTYRVSSSESYAYAFTLMGAVSGAGKIEITQDAGANCNAGRGVTLNCDMSAFAGEVEFYQGVGSSGGKRTYQKRSIDVIYPQATSEKARWNIFADHWGDVAVDRASGNYFAQGSSVYKFGALKLRLPSTASDSGYQSYVTNEVGCLDEDSYSVDSWKKAVGCGFNWIAKTATFSNSSANTAFINVTGGGTVYLACQDGVPTTNLTFAANGGTLKVGYDLVADANDETITNAVPVDPSAALKDCTAAIVFDDQGTNATWETALAASNVGGFTKKGNGTLTLSAAPLYTGLTKVAEGELVVPNDASVTLDATSAGTLKGGTIAKAVYPAATTNSTVVTDLTGVSVKAYDTTLDVSGLTVDFTAKTDWARGATYYVVTDAGVVTATSISGRRNATLLLPADQQGRWSLAIVDCNGKKALAVRPRQGMIFVIR